MISYYEQQIKLGEEFQDHVMDVLRDKCNLIIQCYSSRRSQYGKGESAQGVEIKFDNVLAKTGNLYIETHERAGDRGGAFVESGILRRDHWLYIIGNYAELFLFQSNILRDIYRCLIEQDADKNRGTTLDPSLYVWPKTVRPKGFENDTSRGFLLVRDVVLQTNLYARHVTTED